MRISVNLASKPFVELRPLLARLRLAMALLALLAVGLGVWAGSLSERARLATAQMDALTAQTAAVESARARNESRMRQPENRGLLERAHFLNALFAAKSFSWTAVMMDLERVLPPGVQVTSIEPNILKEGGVDIRLRVTGDRNRAIELVRNLERSDRFAQPRLSGETALTAERAKALSGSTTVAATAPDGTQTAFSARPGGQAGGVQTVSTATGPGVLALGNGVEFEIFSGYVPLPERRLANSASGGTSTRPHKRSADIAPAAGESTRDAAQTPVAQTPATQTPAAQTSAAETSTTRKRARARGVR